MASYNEAYDLELFRPREPRLVALEENKKLVQQKGRRTRLQAVANVTVYLLVAAVVMGLVGYLITCNVRLTEMNKTISDHQVSLNILQSERVRLEAELSSKTSAAQAERYALENGMFPVDSSQIHYISSGSGDLVTLPQSGQNWLQQAWQAVKNIFS